MAEMIIECPLINECPARRQMQGLPWLDYYCTKNVGLCEIKKAKDVSGEYPENMLPDGRPISCDV